MSSNDVLNQLSAHNDTLKALVAEQSPAGDKANLREYQLVLYDSTNGGPGSSSDDTQATVLRKPSCEMVRKLQKEAMRGSLTIVLYRRN